jgi:hypothetical protein
MAKYHNIADMAEALILHGGISVTSAWNVARAHFKQVAEERTKQEERKKQEDDLLRLKRIAMTPIKVTGADIAAAMLSPAYALTPSELHYKNKCAALERDIEGYKKLNDRLTRGIQNRDEANARLAKALDDRISQSDNQADTIRKCEVRLKESSETIATLRAAGDDLRAKNSELYSTSIGRDQTIGMLRARLRSAERRADDLEKRLTQMTLYPERIRDLKVVSVCHGGPDLRIEFSDGQQVVYAWNKP